ncbi:hybrid sensor histidine kinase/response regulator [Bradyrhizobium sacchari]|uniref:histidine kinase n=1 Tax=Bradyrhizobium sacchari TaxID=1399419 RepID=A0A560K040_9BRAD|nr:ATP-binding protein [Bradyrhizobium sacchari]OPY99725.1 hybrid sensor histidine kinase/response regulator [Bradyrhizobium sacchari]TWB62381.1 signal transduction histidine kinase [Bradyrhizobium sacchari]TWB76691.1 signal transduction histidine kinase [Bradyrhizobium sacchari]
MSRVARSPVLSERAALQPTDVSFLAGGGELGAMMRALDWSDSPLGPPNHWSQALKTTVGMLLAAQAQIVLFWGPDFVALYNDAYAPGIGANHPRALGRPAIENWGELWDDLEPLLAGVRRTRTTFAAKDRPFYVERHGYGETSYWDVSYSAVPDDDGSVGGVLCIVSETTERVLGETQLRASEARYRELNATLEQRVAERTAERHLLATIVETTDGQIQALDLDYRWLAINASCAAAYERIYGKRPKVGDSLHEFLADRPEHLAAATAVWSRALGGEAFTTIEEFGDPSFDRRVYEMKFEALRAPDGTRIGAFLTGMDVTDRLEEQVRLAQAEEALRQAQKMEAMGQLTGGVAHDFNNLLTPIVGLLDMFQRRGIGGEREHRLIAGAAQAAERAKTLVQRLLAFARRQPLQAVPVDISRLVGDMGDLISSTTGPRIEVTVDAPEGLPEAMADPNQIEMAILNLSVNARDAMPDGGKLRISAKARTVERAHRSGPTPGTYVCISVADTGIGMDEETLAHAVEPFFSTKGVGQGTGLGLSMVHGLASQLGGALTIRSAVGAGTTVELWLPVSHARPGAIDTAPQPKLQPLPAGTALLVDDEPLVRMSTAEMLSELGYTVVEAGSAEDALQRVREGLRPNLLVTDHLMPGMSGTDLGRVLRNQYPELQILIVSGYSNNEGITPDLSRLTKPFRSDELAASLAKLAQLAQ